MHVQDTSRELIPQEPGWADFLAWTPRPLVRLAVRDHEGVVTNDYRGRRLALLGSPPVVPWAMYLADDQGRFRFLAFDFDDRDGTGVDIVPLTSRLDTAGIEYLVAASGGGGGRHVWVGLAEPVEAGMVAAVARLVKAIAPGLDTAALLNPVTGCVRPPGSPHRVGDRSRIIVGDRGVLDCPSTTRGQLEDLASALSDDVGALVAQEVQVRSRPPRDDRGFARLPGQRRELPGYVAGLLAAVPEDASAVLWRILVAAARARWSLFEVRALRGAPGFEHVRSQRIGPRRRVRGREAQGRVLVRQWDRAVAWVAAQERRRRDAGESAYVVRVSRVVEAIEETLAQARVTPGRWASSRGAAARRVLDAVCLFAAQAGRVQVQADVRRIAMTVGITRQQAAIALWDLADEGLVMRVHEARGVEAATWGLIHRSASESRTKANNPTPQQVEARRVGLVAELGARIQEYAHDVFTAGGLGLTGVVPEGIDRDRLAAALGCAGVLAARAAQYWLERALWRYGGRSRADAGGQELSLGLVAPKAVRISWRQAYRQAGTWMNAPPGPGISWWAAEAQVSTTLARAVVAGLFVAGVPATKLDWWCGHLAGQGVVDVCELARMTMSDDVLVRSLALVGGTRLLGK